MTVKFGMTVKKYSPLTTNYFLKKYAKKQKWLYIDYINSCFAYN